jgi:putative membrane protein
MTRTLTFALVAILSLSVTAQQAPPAVSPKIPDSAKAALNPADFVTRAADHSRKAVEAGTLAADKSSNADVRTLARRMVVDHTAALEDLAKFAKARNITMMPFQKQIKPATGEVTAMEGADFDRTYVDQTIKELTEVLAMYSEEKDDGQDPEIEDWADKKFEALEEQLRMAKEIQIKTSR